MCFNESLVWQPCTERHWLHFPYNEPCCINIFATFSYTRVIYNRYRNIFPSRNDNHLPSPTCISSQKALSRIPLAVNTSVTNHTCCLPPSALVSHCWWPPNGFFFFFIVHDHKLNHVSNRTGPVEIEPSSTQHCQKGKSMAFKSPQLQRRTRAVMQTPISEKPSRNPELYLNTNDKNKKCSIHTH